MKFHSPAEKKSHKKIFQSSDASSRGKGEVKKLSYILKKNPETPN